MSRCPVAAFAISLAIASALKADEATDHFESMVRPVLVEKCYSCHTGKQRGGLRLDSRTAALKGGQTGAAVVVGKPADSLLIKVIRRAGELKMPPNKPLEPHEVEAIERWVREGAVWTELKGKPAAKADSGISDAERSFWSFQLIANPAVPKIDGIEHPIDAFIAAKLAEKQLAFGKPATKQALIRRATFDLIGLPPTPAEIAAFIEDDSAEAFSKLVDRLLKSRHYGERWGRHWLDLVRYADTAGDSGDFPIPETYKYRNYVIDSFNKDKPYDDFIREQIAGDLLPSANDDERWEKQIATGYLAISRRVGVSPRNLRHIVIEDTINNLGKTFLGLTVSCARCHDHKFDPIPTTDYYALYGIFDSSTYPHPGEEHHPWRRDFVYRIGKVASDELLLPHREVLAKWDKQERAKFEEYRDFQRKPITDPNKSREKAWAAVLAVREQRRVDAEKFPELEIAYAVHEGSPHDVHVQEAGDPSRRAQGELVRRGFLQVLGGQTLPDGHQGSGRLELASWIADPKNPLTARVIVNRVWHHHFGKGLVKTTSDFGIRGTRPTHPELLDYLATWFIEHDWSIKELHRLIMSSQTYQLTSADITANSKIDPENDYLWRANRRRLDAEQLRDSLLAISGQLDRSVGRRHPFDHHLTYFYRQHEPFVADWETKQRSLYQLQQRIKKNDYLDLFDGPDGNLSFGGRKATTTTLQALFFMNSEFVHQQADAIAARLAKEESAPTSRVQLAYRSIFGRDADDAEVEHATKTIEQLKMLLADDVPESQGWASYVRGMISSNSFMFIE